MTNPKFPLGGAGAAIANGLFSRNMKTTVVNGSAANVNIAISGIDPSTDDLISVIHFESTVTTQAVKNITDETANCRITSFGNIQCTNSTTDGSGTVDWVLVVYSDRQVNG